MSVRPQILDNIVATLQGITIAGGYSFDMGEVKNERYQWEDWGGNETWPKTCIYSDSEQFRHRIGWNILDLFWNITIRLFYKGNNADDVIDGYIGEVRQSLLESGSLTRGGYAWNTCYAGTGVIENTFEEDRHHASIELNFIVRYREVLG